MEDKKIWGIHTMDDHLFLNNNIIAIGWKAIEEMIAESETQHGK